MINRWALLCGAWKLLVGQMARAHAMSPYRWYLVRTEAAKDFEDVFVLTWV